MVEVRPQLIKLLTGGLAGLLLLAGCSSSGEYEVEYNKADVRAPVYPAPTDRLRKAGECVHGWGVAKVPAKAKPVRIRYSNRDGDVAEWRVG